MTDQQQRELARGLRALADSTRDRNASDRVEAAVLAQMGSADGPPVTVAGAHVARVHAARRTPASSKRADGSVREGRSHVFLPLAAALILAVGGALWTARTVHPTRTVDPAGFVALPEAAVLPQMESANIVRVLLPVAALPGYGIFIVDLKVDSVVAELLVAQDGRPRAIRLVNDSD